MASAHHHPAAFSDLRVLIVEDSAERRAFFLNLYQGHKVEFAGTCTEAIAAISETVFDIFHLDFDLIDETTTAVASFMNCHPTDVIIVIHTDNPIGSVHLARLLPSAIVLPISSLRRPGDKLSKLKKLLASGGRSQISAVRHHLQNW